MGKKRELVDPLVASNNLRGRLFIVGTPIGNLEDITLRAIRTLKEADVIACEDTRRTQKLLNHYDVRTPTVSYHDHNEMTRAPELIIKIEQGLDIALVTDAGMPVASDPGYRLVHLAIRHNVPIIPVPGASAFVAALAASGLPVDKFRFLGFLPRKRAARRKALEEIKRSTKTLVFYEAPHRVIEMLEDVRTELGDRPVVVAREVTKIHEEFLRGPVSEVLGKLGTKRVKGEITVLVGGPEAEEKRPAPVRSIKKELERLMAERRLNARGALKVVARSRGISRSEAYRRLQIEKSASRATEN